MARIRNTHNQYGLIAIALHWTVALLFLAAYCAVKYRHWFTEKDTPENWTALQLHLSIGITIAVFVLLRVIWRLVNQLPETLSHHPLANMAAHWGHRMLYAIMLIAPITGYLGSGVSVDYFSLFEIPKFESTGVFQMLLQSGIVESWESFEAPVDFIHKELLGEFLIPILVLGHIAAALYHHFKLKDRTLRRMVGL